MKRSRSERRRRRRERQDRRAADVATKVSRMRQWAERHRELLEQSRATKGQAALIASSAVRDALIGARDPAEAGAVALGAFLGAFLEGYSAGRIGLPYPYAEELTRDEPARPALRVIEGGKGKP